MCQLDDSTILEWEGWHTTLGELKSKGWVISEKLAYDNWKQSTDSAASHDKIYLRHPVHKTIGRIKFSREDEPGKLSYLYNLYGDRFCHQVNRYTLDFLAQECNKWVKPPRWIEEKEFTQDDIPKLMNIILDIQEKTKRRKQPTKKILQQAEILLLRRA